LLEERKAAWKKSAQSKKRSLTGPSIRGRWVAPQTKRQSPFDQGTGPAFDGSSGVDAEDIINIPQIGFGSFQLFPDQNNYGPDDPNLSAFNNTVQTGLTWIQTHEELAQLFNKPVTLTGFGLVTQSNAPVFVPFNSTEAPFGSDGPDGPDPPSSTTAAAPTATQSFGVTDAQRDDAYAQWLQAGLKGGLGGLSQYQWSQSNLTTGAGTAIEPTVTGTGVSPDVTGTGDSPNDGYGLQGQGQAGAVGVLSTSAQAFGSDAT
jgi:mannan endo-1,4-beta-mannosidase